MTDPTYPGVYLVDREGDENTDAARGLAEAFPHPVRRERQGLILDLLVAKGYLKVRYPLTEAVFGPALIAALTAAPHADLLKGDGSVR